MFRRMAWRFLDFLGVADYLRARAPSFLFRSLPDEKLQDMLCTYLDDSAKRTVKPLQHTDKLKEADMEAAMAFHAKALRIREWASVAEPVKVMPLDINVKALKPGELTRWYRDLHRPAPMSDETMEFRAQDSGKMRRQG